MLGVSASGELLVAVTSAAVIALIALGLGLAQIRERVARIEEWIRVREQK